jgi:DNA invertase Pin-like site-specific DNA recombinase
VNQAKQDKVHAKHLERNAYLYVRQSTLRQVNENTESTKRQYALQQRAVALGWQQDQIVVIDSDLGQSGASSVERTGFQRLVADVGMGRAGIVMGLEVSRLARNSSDWHKLLEICALFDTLILDEDGVYDPSCFNDRLVLGLKGTMSEAELHLIRARMNGGILSKAKRGELRCTLPVGFVYDESARVILDPDQQVQETIRAFFETFRRTSSATATVREFRQEKLLFPRRLTHGERKGDTIWVALDHSRALRLLHHPRYAGAFVFGRTRSRGNTSPKKQEREDWIALLQDAHCGYIGWTEFERNQELLRENSAIHGSDRRHGPPREGPALLQGIVVCGVCGERMTVRYQRRNGQLAPIYVCQRSGIKNAESICQSIPGTNIDEAIGALVIEVMKPQILEATLAVQRELETRFEEADVLRHKQVERAHHEETVARRRYMSVDPTNRLVADSLEAEWNVKLRALAEAKDQYTRQRDIDHQLIDGEKSEQIIALCNDVPKLWHDPATPQRERKRMLRLVVDDITLLKEANVVANVRFRGGTTRTLLLPRALPIWKLRRIDSNVVSEIDRMLNTLNDDEIAAALCERGFKTYEGVTADRRMVQRIRRGYDLKSRFERLREAGMLTVDEVAEQLGVCRGTVNQWRRQGFLCAVRYDEKGDHLYQPLGQDMRAKYQRKSSTPNKGAPKNERSAV